MESFEKNEDFIKELTTLLNDYYESEILEETTTNNFEQITPLLEVSSDAIDPYDINELSELSVISKLLSRNDLTFFVSSLSVLILLTISFLIYLTIRCKKLNPISEQRMIQPANSEKSENVEQRGLRGFNGDFLGLGSSSLPTSSSGSGRKMSHKLVPHKNIITPDKTITFVVPTIQMPCQEQDQEGEFGSGVSRSEILKVPMNEERFYPQFQQDECLDPIIGFNLFYNNAGQLLSFNLSSGSNFPADLAHTVQVKLYPGRGGKQKSREIEGSSPAFNQEFQFHVRRHVLHTKVLKVRVLEGKFILGSFDFPLKNCKGMGTEFVDKDIRSGHMWRKVEAPPPAPEGLKLTLSLKWEDEPKPGLLTLKVHDATGLHENYDSEFISTYVKVSLQEQGRHIKSRKTRLIRWGSLPNYNETFVVTLPHHLLSQVSFHLVLMARGRLGSKICLGKISIGPVPYAHLVSTAGTEFWEDLSHQPNNELWRSIPLQ